MPRSFTCYAVLRMDWVLSLFVLDKDPRVPKGSAVFWWRGVQAAAISSGSPLLGCCVTFVRIGPFLFFAVDAAFRSLPDRPVSG